MILVGRDFCQSRSFFVVREQLCGVCRTLLLSYNDFTEGGLMKIDWSVTNVTAVGSPDRAERAILGLIVAGRVFGQSSSCLWSEGHFVV